MPGVPRLRVEGLAAGHGRVQILHELDLELAPGEALCLIGPNGAGKSTVLNAIFGFADIHRGSIEVDGREVTRLGPSEKLSEAGIGYVLQESSVFPDLTVEQNVALGAYLIRDRAAARAAVDRVFERNPVLAERRRDPARVLSGGERRLLEIARALIMDPRLLLVDEPTMGLEPRFITMVFEVLDDLRRREGSSILIVEQNARRALQFADFGQVLVAGRTERAGPGRELLEDPAVSALFLGE